MKLFNGYRKTQVIAINALLCALVLLFFFFPITIGILSLAIVPIIAIIISAEVMGVFNGALTGLFFGIISLAGSFVRPNVLSFAFYNPLVSIVPRILIGVASFYVAKAIFKMLPKAPKIFGYAAGAMAGVITNTTGVLGMILTFYEGRLLNNGSAISFEWVSGIIITNSILEIVVCTIVTPPIVMAIKKVLSTQKS
ncbi:ECF transporter S component [bacterium]|nr:ECF transporter S component [bacterium]